MKATGLGKGLDALMGEYAPTQEETNEVSIHLLDPNREQARKKFDPEKLQELADSIRNHGIIQPILVKANGQRYSIVAGERRWRAAQLAGLSTVPIIVREYDDQAILEVSLIENLQRTDLNPVEEAMGMRFLMSQHDLTQEEVSERLGKSRPTIANSLRLLSLPEKIIEMLQNAVITPGHARAIMAVKNEADQMEMADTIERTQMSVRDAEKLAKRINDGEKPKVVSSDKIPTADDIWEVHRLEEELRLRLGTRVKISGTMKNGKIQIEFYSEDELSRLYNHLMNDEPIMTATSPHY